MSLEDCANTLAKSKTSVWECVTFTAERKTKQTLLSIRGISNASNNLSIALSTDIVYSKMEYIVSRQ